MVYESVGLAYLKACSSQNSIIMKKGWTDGFAADTRQWRKKENSCKLTNRGGMD